MKVEAQWGRLGAAGEQQWRRRRTQGCFGFLSTARGARGLWQACRPQGRYIRCGSVQVLVECCRCASYTAASCMLQSAPGLSTLHYTVPAGVPPALCRWCAPCLAPPPQASWRPSAWPCLGLGAWRPLAGLAMAVLFLDRVSRQGREFTCTYLRGILL